MKNYIAFLLVTIVFTWGCASGGRVMTVDEFSQVSIGMTKEEVQKKFGKPYTIKTLEDGSFEYVYIEKVHYGPRVIEERHYLIIFQNGRVTSTKVRDFTRPVYERNSYEMQTSYNEEES